MKKNLMFSAFTLLCTLFLLVCIITAWYVTNKEVTASGVTGSTEGDHYTLKLQRGTYSSTEDKWTWIDTEHLSFTNISPKNSFYFRIALDIEQTDEDISLSAKFADISSTLIDNKLVVKEGYVGVNDGSSFHPLYQLTNNQVIIKEIIEGQTQNRVLYDNTSGSLVLDDYLIQNTFKFYSFGLVEPDNNILPVEDPDTEEKEDNSVSLSELDSFPIEIKTTDIKNNEAYYYFALEFNEALTLVTQEGETEANSNCYMYQKLSIGYISISKL